MQVQEQIPNYIAGEWKKSGAGDWQPVKNPATQEILADVPLSNADDVNAAVEAAAAAFPDWRRTPPEERIQPLFKLKQLLEDNLDELAASSLRRMARLWANRKASCAAPSKMWKSPAEFPH